MSYSLKEVQAIVGELLTYNELDEIFADMGTKITENGLVYNDVGDKHLETLRAFVNDSTIK